jgi:hypothetical protein
MLRAQLRPGVLEVPFRACATRRDQEPYTLNTDKVSQCPIDPTLR